MTLNEEQKEMLRNAILMQLNAARATGLRTNPIMVGCRLAGFQALEENDLAKNLRYLESHGLIARDDKTISKAVAVYLITDAGVAHLDEAGLI